MVNLKSHQFDTAKGKAKGLKGEFQGGGFVTNSMRQRSLTTGDYRSKLAPSVLSREFF
jgi:hypothetical protein